MEIKATFIENGSHGYLLVEKNDFIKVIDKGQEKLISEYSGLKGNTVYLEEDEDAITFIETAKGRGYEVSYTESFQPDFLCPPRNYIVHMLLNLLYL